jgi:hypothetical protein
LQFLARFESNGFAFRNGHLRAGARVAAYATLARLNHENAEPAKRSPRFIASFMASKRASTATSAFIFGTPVFSATLLMMSSLITNPPALQSVYSISRLFVFDDICKKAGRIIETAFMGVKLANQKRDAVSV